MHCYSKHRIQRRRNMLAFKSLRYACQTQQQATPIEPKRWPPFVLSLPLHGIATRSDQYTAQRIWQLVALAIAARRNAHHSPCASTPCGMLACQTQQKPCLQSQSVDRLLFSRCHYMHVHCYQNSRSDQCTAQRIWQLVPLAIAARTGDEKRASLTLRVHS